MGCLCACVRAHPIAASQKRLGRSRSNLLCGLEPIRYEVFTCHGSHFTLRSARAHVHTSYLYLRNGLSDCAQICCVFVTQWAVTQSVCAVSGLRGGRFARWAVRAVGGLRGWPVAVCAVGRWRFARLAVCAVGGLRGWRFARLAVCAIGGLRGWRFARLAVRAVCVWRLAVCVWRFAFCVWRFAFDLWRFAFGGLRFSVCGWRLAVCGLRLTLLFYSWSFAIALKIPFQ